MNRLADVRRESNPGWDPNLLLPDSLIARVNNLTPQSGGLTHHVWRVVTETEDWYLKVRGTTHRAIPTLPISPTDIAFEANAIQLLKCQFCDVIPDVLRVNAENGALILSDVKGRNGEYLSDILERRMLDEQEARSLGIALGKIHLAGRYAESDPRRGDPTDYYERNLSYRVTLHSIERFDHLVEKLRKLPRSIIHGDFCPKNLALRSDGTVTAFDFDCSHLGNIEFDLGYCVGHLLLHAAAKSKIETICAIDSFLSGYKKIQDNGTSIELIRETALATIAYRAVNPLIPYKLPFDDRKRHQIVQTIRELPSSVVPTFSDILDLLHGDQLNESATRAAAKDEMVTVLKDRGLEEEEIDAIIENLVAAEASGRPTHGLSRAQWVSELISQGKIVPSNLLPEIVERDAHVYLIDGRQRSGYYVLSYALDRLVPLLNERPLVIFGITNSGPSVGYFGNYARKVAERGLIFIACANTAGGLAPFGSREPMLGTNPYTFGIPNGTESPVVLDSACSAITWGEAILAHRQHRRLPPHSAITKDGIETRDPSEALQGALLAAAGPKGSGLALVIDLLAGALTNSRVGRDVAPGGWGVCGAIVNPNLFGFGSTFSEKVAGLITEIKGSKKLDPKMEIFFPGEPGRRISSIQA